MEGESPDYKSGRKPGIKYDEGGISSAALPDPIPNSEVKRARANDSHTHVCAKVGGCLIYKKLSSKARVFYYVIIKPCLQLFWFYFYFLRS